MELKVGVALPSDVKTNSYWTYWLLLGAQVEVMAPPEAMALQLVQAGASDKLAWLPALTKTDTVVLVGAVAV
jgi:hypothetical protein